MNLSEANQATIGILHPGQMGVSVAAALVENNHSVMWAGQGRSADTRSRAEAVNLIDVETLARLCESTDTVFSICPPDQATALASHVAQTGFTGTYVDGNAVSPGTAKDVADIVTARGANYVDGGIIGPPAKAKGTTRLYLSGDMAPSVASLFKDSVLDARVVGQGVGAASALKMAYAGWTKGSTALLMTQFALAREQGVEATLLEEWALSQPGLAERLRIESTRSAPKAWRFVGEMNEIAKTLEEAGLSKSWFVGASETYSRLTEFKNETDLDESDIIAALLNKQCV